MRDYFDIKEFLIDPEMAEVPVHVVQKIDQYHKPILNNVRHLLRCPVIISQHSGYRSVKWERSHGRTGDSQHTFSERGAVDVRSDEKLDRLLMLLKASEYSRVCYYPHDKFIHCDFYGATRKYFEANKSGTWNFKGNR